MNVSIDGGDFKALLKLAYLGNWLANAIHNGSAEDTQDEALENAEQLIFSLADKFGLEKYVEYDAEIEEYFPSQELENEMNEYIEEYDEDNFWDELFHRLSDRDFVRDHTAEEIEAMDWRDLLRSEEPYRKKWDDELNKFGITRLEINQDADFSADA